MVDTTEKTVADELKQAVKTLRCDHRFPCQPPDGTLWAPGPCLRCGIPCPDDDEEIPEALREPLAAWLEETARYAETDIKPDPDDGVPIHEDDVCGGVVGKDCACFNAPLAVARVINGTAS